MLLDKQTLLELSDYIDALDTQIGLKAETLNDIGKAIGKAHDKLRSSRHDHLKPRITTHEYSQLTEDKKDLYMRFCGHNEVYYTIKP